MEKKFGLIHYNFKGTLEEFLDYASRTGFGFVELLIGDVWNETSETEADAIRRAESIREMLDVRGLEVSALAASNDFIFVDEDEIRRQVKRMESVCHIAKALGCSILRTDGGSPKPSVPQECWADAISECLKQVAEFGEREGCYFALDNHGLVTNDARLQIQVFKKVNSPHVGANLDTMNYRWAGHDLALVQEFYKEIAPYVLHTHMKDGTGSRQEYIGRALGEGEIDLVYAVNCLKEIGYSGVWCAEYEGKEDSRIGYRKGLEWLKAHI